MRRVDYDEYRKAKGPERVRIRAAILNERSGRMPRQRPRSPEEEMVLGRLIRARYQRLLDSGELVKLGPRRWRWNFPEFRQESQSGRGPQKS